MARGRGGLTHGSDGLSRMAAVVASVAAGELALSGGELPVPTSTRLAYAAGQADALGLPEERRPRERLWKLPKTLDAPPGRVAAVRRAVALSERLAVAAQLLCDSTASEQVHKEQADLVDALWAQALGRKDAAHTARMELVEAISLAAKGTCSAETALQVYAWFWPEYAEALSQPGFGEAVAGWRKSRNAKSAMTSACLFLRSAGLSPPAPESLAQDWSRWHGPATPDGSGESA